MPGPPPSRARGVSVVSAVALSSRPCATPVARPADFRRLSLELSGRPLLCPPRARVRWSPPSALGRSLLVLSLVGSPHHRSRCAPATVTTLATRPLLKPVVPLTFPRWSLASLLPASCCALSRSCDCSRAPCRLLAFLEFAPPVPVALASGVPGVVAPSSLIPLWAASPFVFDSSFLPGSPLSLRPSWWSLVLLSSSEVPPLSCDLFSLSMVLLVFRAFLCAIYSGTGPSSVLAVCPHPHTCALGSPGWVLPPAV